MSAPLSHGLSIQVVLERIHDWFLQDCYELGLIAKRLYEMQWTPPAFESIDREKEAKADILEVLGGLSSLRKLIGARGENIEDMKAEIEGDREFVATLIEMFGGYGGNLGAGQQRRERDNASTSNAA